MKWTEIPFRLKMALAVWMFFVAAIAMLGWLVIKETDDYLKQETIGSLESQVEQAVLSMDQWFERYELITHRISGSEIFLQAARGGSGETLEMLKKEMKAWKYALPGIVSLKLIEVDPENGSWDAMNGRVISVPESVNPVMINQAAQANLRQVMLVNGVPQWFRSAQGWFGQRQPISLTLAQRLYEGDRASRTSTWIMVMDISLQTWINDLSPFWKDDTGKLMVFNSIGEPINESPDSQNISYSTFSFSLHGEHSGWVQTIENEPYAVVSRTTARAPWIVAGYSAMNRTGQTGYSGALLIICASLLFLSGGYFLLRLVRYFEKQKSAEALLVKLKEDVARYRLLSESSQRSEADVKSELERIMMQRDSWFRQVKQLERSNQLALTNQSNQTVLWKSTVGRCRSLIQEIQEVLHELNSRASDRWAVNELNAVMDQMDLYLTLMGSNEVIQPKPVVLRDLVTTSWESGTFRQTAGGVSLRNDISSMLPPVMIDPLRMRYVFQYLFSQIMLIGTRGQLVVSAELSGNFVTVMVREPGYGISVSQWEALFGGKDMSKSLGAAIVHQLVIAHGGTIRVEANDRQGCAVVFTLPLAIGIMHPMEQM